MFSSLHLLVALLPSVAHALSAARHLQEGGADPYVWPSGDPKSVGGFVPKSAKSVSPNWPRHQWKARRPLLGRSESYGDQLDRLSIDDEADTELWANMSAFKMKDASSFYDSLCNGTDMSHKMPGDASKLTATGALTALKKWTLQNASLCSEFISSDEITDPVKALTKCGDNSNCGGLADVGCERKKFKLCVAGSFPKMNVTGQCLLFKPGDYVAPAGLPRPPLKLDFWAKFCKYRIKGRLLRVLYEGKTCAEDAVKKLDTVANQVECGELASKDDACEKGPIFDYSFGPPAVCRCLKKEKSCKPTNATGNVFAPSEPSYL